MVSDEPDVDGNISVPLDEDADSGITLWTGGWDPGGALLRARGLRVTWGYLSEPSWQGQRSPTRRSAMPRTS
jgi:hypothetical protein